jgi:hypothetical protein
VSALNFFLMYFKFFKYLSRVPRMEVILSTLTLAAVDLALFSVTAVIIMFGFSAAFYVCFGMEVRVFESLFDSVLHGDPQRSMEDASKSIKLFE